MTTIPPTRGVTGGTLPAEIWRSAMLTAERGLRLRPLDRSLPPPPPEEDVLAFGSNPPPASDDESTAMAQAQPAPEEAPRHRAGALDRLFGWLFGDDDQKDNRDAAAPPPR